VATVARWFAQDFAEWYFRAARWPLWIAFALFAVCVAYAGYVIGGKMLSLMLAGR
jgi:hypothetical protein